MSLPDLFIATVRSPTIEHVIEVRAEAIAAGASVRMLDFGATAYSLDISDEENQLLKESILVSDQAMLESLITTHRQSVVLLQSPYSEHYPQWFPGTLTQTASAYAGYGIALSSWTSGHFETPLIRSTDYLFAGSQYEESGYRNANASATVLLTGNPLLWRVRQLVARPQDDYARNRNLLWAPHWTASWFGARGFARFDKAIAPITDWAEQHPTLTLTVRPHPLLRSALQSRHGMPRNPTASNLDTLLSEAILEKWHELVALPNVQLSENSFVHDVVTHNALVTDGVSIIAYFAATGKPLCVFFDEDSPRLNGTGMNLLESLDLVDSEYSLRGWLASVNADNSAVSEARLASTALLFPTYAHSPVEIWLERCFGSRS